MLGSTMHFLFYGLIWLFIFSCPVGKSKKLFDLGHEYIVDSKPVHEVTSYVSSIFNKTKNTVTEEIKK